MDDSKEETVDVYVNCEYNNWSCRPATLYKIPTEIFNYNMMIGSLEDENDLQQLVNKIDQNIVYDEYTDVYVGADKNWSGVESILFQIPLDVFDYLNNHSKQSTNKTIGRLENQSDLQTLIEKTRYGMINGEVKTLEIVYSKPKNGELKNCGHTCTMSCLKTGCCMCMDMRELRDEGKLSTILIFCNNTNTNSDDDRHLSNVC